MSQLPALPVPSARRPPAPSASGPPEARDFPDVSATLRPAPAPISCAAAAPFRNALSLPSSPALCERFMQHSSRVVRLVDVRSTPTHLLWSLFTHACAQNKIAAPTPMLAHPNAAAFSGGIWAVFSSHEDARAALGLGCDLFTVSPALESDLAMHSALKRLTLDHHGGFLPPPDMSHDIYSTGGPRQPFYPRPPADPQYTISSNPPNPKTSFRAGDWMCSAPSCSAHNFQRNIACIVCGRQRAGGPPPLSIDTAHALASPSPRFAGRFPHAPLPSPPFLGAPAVRGPPPPSSSLPPPPPPPQYPPLTPSGRALSVGGRVRNIARDPLAPCVMYWPDNEPLPEACQLRPMDSALMTYPPIVNTGNKGAAEKQPGDWLCGKCHYHNWRRRKVCQTCFPYAEGNGDSISPAVQAERIALLTNVLTQFGALDLGDGPGPGPASASSPAQPPFQHFPYAAPLAHDSDKDAFPIYQTSGGAHPHPHARGTTTIPLPPARFLPGPGLFPTAKANAAAHASPPGTRTLLPAFLQDLVHAPSHSPSSASSSSIDGSSEDAHYASSSGTSAHSHAQQGPYGATAHNGNANTSTSSFSSLTGNTPGSIWRLDGEESRTLTSAPGGGSGQSSAGTTPAPFAHARRSPPHPQPIPQPAAAPGRIGLGLDFVHAGAAHFGQARASDAIWHP
ncbi:hypothetical protein C2E23DRAFT_882502 [Lenzites betulinus]|nr:hypothetical protein C2E23DRAFT_882502 [Lenzites betulinus]